MNRPWLWDTPLCFSCNRLAVTLAVSLKIRGHRKISPRQRLSVPLVLNCNILGWMSKKYFLTRWASRTSAMSQQSFFISSCFASKSRVTSLAPWVWKVKPCCPSPLPASPRRRRIVVGEYILPWSMSSGRVAIICATQLKRNVHC